MSFISQSIFPPLLNKVLPVLKLQKFLLFHITHLIILQFILEINQIICSNGELLSKTVTEISIKG